MGNLCSSPQMKKRQGMLKNKRGLTVQMTGPLHKCVRNVMHYWPLAIGWRQAM
jgi:hypothetical protein